jgi:hypothetical protein
MTRRWNPETVDAAKELLEGSNPTCELSQEQVEQRAASFLIALAFEVADDDDRGATARRLLGQS